MYRATKATQHEKYLGADVVTMGGEMDQCQKVIKKLLTASSKLENAALAMLDFKELPTSEFTAKYPAGTTWGEVAGQTRAALREWRAVMQEVKAVTDD